MPGERVCGDHCLVYWEDDLALIVVADGLGHGPDAGLAAQRACDVARDSASLDLGELMLLCDAALSETRGAAVALLRIDAGHHRLDHTAVGNVEVAALSASPIRPVSIGGVVGGRIRKILEQSYTLTRGDRLAIYTDGVSGKFELEAYRGLTAQCAAESIVDDWGRNHDDATCVVVDY